MCSVRFRGPHTQVNVCCRWTTINNSGYCSKQHTCTLLSSATCSPMDKRVTPAILKALKEKIFEKIRLDSKFMRENFVRMVIDRDVAEKRMKTR